MQLRPYQEKAYDGIRKAFASGHKRVCLASPCGSGKTVIFSYIANRIKEMGKSALILAHRRELIEQTSDTLKKFDIPHGLILSGQQQTTDKIQAGMVLTAGNRLNSFSPDLIIVDESHRVLAKTYQKVIDAFPNPIF